MQTNTGKRTAKVRTTLTKRVIEALEPTDTSWIAWDDKLKVQANLCAVYGAASAGTGIPYLPNRQTIPRRTTASLFLTV